MIDTGRDQFNRSCLFWIICPATDIELSNIWRFKCSSISLTTVSLPIVKSRSSIRSAYQNNSLRGPAPIHHAMMRNEKYTGVSLQTLDPKAFDHGVVLAQTPSPGIPIPAGTTLQQLTESLAKVGAEMLVQGLRDGVHVPPYTNAGWMAGQLKGEELVHAPKVSKGESQINWPEWDSRDVARFLNIFSTVWTHARNDKGKFKRVLFLDAESVSEHDVAGRSEEIVFRFERGNEGHDIQRNVRVDDEHDAFYIQMADESWVCVRNVKVDGKTTQTAKVGMREFMKKMK